MGRGRPARFVEDGNGNLVFGLSAQPYKGDRIRYYATFSSPRKWLGVGVPGNAEDLDRAIAAFKVWLRKVGQPFELVGEDGERGHSFLPDDFVMPELTDEFD